MFLSADFGDIQSGSDVPSASRVNNNGFSNGNSRLAGTKAQHRRIRIKSIQCEVCSKMFPDKANLARHMRSHTGEKPFICATCGRGFTRKATLISHQSTHVSMQFL